MLEGLTDAIYGYSSQMGGRVFVKTRLRALHWIHLRECHRPLVFRTLGQKVTAGSLNEPSHKHDQ